MRATGPTPDELRQHADEPGHSDDVLAPDLGLREVLNSEGSSYVGAVDEAVLDQERQLLGRSPGEPRVYVFTRHQIDRT